MKKIVLAAAASLALYCAPAFAAAPEKSAASVVVTPAQDKAARALLDSMGYRDQIRDEAQAMLSGVQVQIKRAAAARIEASKTLSVAQKNEALDKVDKRMPGMIANIEKSYASAEFLDAMVAAQVPVYASRFSAAEMDDLAAFNRTPVGVKMKQVTLELSRASIDADQSVMMPRMMKLVEQVISDK
ncbi:DUF2059 domain-containing protein [Massilia pseudoviolaceinigra]|uniref:DUF2059 domain-containing protein n=1 Tax=Massilia pseudoviolaceinigra TaxID=3057165 RepID=UPI002796CCCE|nr:DUF2059 domain-containing protein [Massilia sp. CCM 9206]MDQ1919408.1 DUF2059 domain-containing protein [Massilia sp. CCM 9206]